MILVPWVAFIAVSCLFAFAYHHVPIVIWLLVILGIALCASQMQSASQRQTAQTLRLIILAMIALCVAAIVGLINYKRFFAWYWFYEDGHTYTEVNPSEPAAGYSDASELMFTNRSHIDVTKSLGYKDVQVYCVAPILSNDPAQNNGPVQFWAAGLDCCAARGLFGCDDAWNPHARGGAVVPSEATLDGGVLDNYRRATRQAEAAFNITSAQTAIVLHWVVDPEQVRRNHFRSGVGMLLISCAVYLALSCLVAGLVHSTSSDR